MSGGYPQYVSVPQRVSVGPRSVSELSEVSLQEETREENWTFAEGSRVPVRLLQYVLNLSEDKCLLMKEGSDEVCRKRVASRMGKLLRKYRKWIKSRNKINKKRSKAFFLVNGLPDPKTFLLDICEERYPQGRGRGEYKKTFCITVSMFCNVQSVFLHAFGGSFEWAV